MDKSSIAIKPVSETQLEVSSAASEKQHEVSNAVSETQHEVSNEDTLSEVVDLPGQARAADVTAPLTFIGGVGGTQHQIRGWTNGQVITRIRVHSGRFTIKAYTIWLTDSNGTTYGEPEGTNFAEYQFEDGERITQLTLWGNGVGTRAGWIEFVTSRGMRFSYGMHGRDRQTPYPVEVASGVMVGCIFNAGSDIYAHGFRFLNHVDYAQLTNVRYPTLNFDTMGIIPELLDTFHFTNNSTTSRQWQFQRSVTRTTSQTWSVRADVSVHASISVQAGIPFVAEVNGQFGWQVGLSSHYETTQTFEREFNWNVQGTADPGHTVDLTALTRMGNINLPYEGTMEVKLRNGTSFRYPIRGTYRGLNYSGVQVVDNSTN